MADTRVRDDGRRAEKADRLRQMPEWKDEKVLKEYVAERGLDIRRLLLANLYVKGTVPEYETTVAETAGRFLKQDGRKGDCFRDSPQEFSILFCQDREDRAEEDLARLQRDLQLLLDTPVYLGVSRTAGECADMLRESRREPGGKGFLLSCAGISDSGLLQEMYRQAAAARENRRFFGMPGCISYGSLRINESVKKEDPSGRQQDFGQSVRIITSCLSEKQYNAAMEELKRFLSAMAAAADFHPAYVHALGNRILDAYLRETRCYALDEEERRDVNGIELWLGWSASDLAELSRALLRVAGFLDDLIRRKNRRASCSLPVRRAMQYAEEHYRENLTLEEVAEYAHLSRAYLSTRFKQETGVKFSGYLQEIRLEQAKRLLSDRELPIHLIAERAGFFDAAHLSRAFKRRYGCSPMEYRRTIGR